MNPRGVGYVTHAALELGVRDELLKADLGRVLMKLEAMQEAAITRTLETAPVGPSMTDAERDAALELLRAPDLSARLLADFAACGLVGEETNKLVGYLAAVSRKLDRPLGVVIQSSSAAGKSSLMDAALTALRGLDGIRVRSRFTPLLLKRNSACFARASSAKLASTHF